MEDQKALLSLSEASLYLGVSVAGLRGWIRKGLLPSVKAGRRTLLSRQLLDARIASGRLLQGPEK